jgi:hypothetical protein
MTTTQRQLSRPTWALLALLAALGSSAALAAGKPVTLDPHARYQREGGACYAIRSPDERADCLSEAGLRLAIALPTPAIENPDALARNALKRCEPLPEPDRKDCVARMQGQGTTSGSVAGGGIYRELVTREVAAVPVAAQPEPATLPAPTK